MTTAKGFKVTDAERKTRVGIAVKSLDDLKKKTIDKFKLVKLSPSSIDFQLTDGTLIETEEYFQTLAAQTLLIWVRKGERAETDAEILYKTIREVNDEYLTAGEKVHEFFSEKMKNKVFKLAEVLRGLNGEKAKLSSRVEDPDWFEGLDTTAKTKEEYMSRRAQDRVRTYYYKTKEELLHQQQSNKNPDLVVPCTSSHYYYKTVHALIQELQTRLKLNKYHGCYFDRHKAISCTTTSTSSSCHPINDINNIKQQQQQQQMSSICDSSGTFRCQGRWDKPECLYKPPHEINPYISREARIIFQTWNMDHQKERSRSVIPAIRQAIVKSMSSGGDGVLKLTSCCCAGSLDVTSIYNDLFTLNNLKLVHIVCHDKGAHTSKKAGPYLIGTDNVKKNRGDLLLGHVENDIENVKKAGIKAA